MLEILLVLGFLILANRKTPAKRRRYNLRRVRLTPERTLGTLASDTVILVGMTGAGTTDYRCVSIKGIWTLVDLTPGEGPITVGFAHSDYTVVEIKECLESVASISQGLKIEAERSNRLVRIVGTFAGGNTSLNDGRPIKTRLNWLMAEGGGNEVNMFAFNEGISALTTGADLNFVGDMWVKD